MLNYVDRLKILRDKKIAHTIEKAKQSGYMDVDDYGTIPIPDDFTFEPYYNTEDKRYFGNDGWSKNYEKMLAVHPVYVDPLEILAGRWCLKLNDFCSGWPQDMMPYDELKAGQELYDINHGIGASSHFVCDYTIGLELGFEGLLDKVRKYRGINSDPEGFYEAEERVIIATQGWIQKHIDLIDELIKKETRLEIIENLNIMKACNENVINKAPKTFLEACQWVAWFMNCSRIYDRDGAGFSLDGLLYPYYKADKDSGLITQEDAEFIIANLLLIETHYYQLSGPDENCDDITNELSYVILEGAHMLNIANNLTVRVHDKMDEKFLDKAVEYLFVDRNAWPRFSGNKGLMNFAKNEGITEKIARSRIAVGCNWMATPGLEYPLNDCIKINMAKVFDVSYHEMMAGDIYSTEILFDIMKKHTEKAVDITARGINFHLDNQYKNMPELVMNLMMVDTIEKGQDISMCARLKTMGIDGVGLAIVADSFAALEQRIEREKRISFNDVFGTICSDFEGIKGERIRLMLSTSEKYCQGNSLGDVWADRVSRMFTTAVKSYEMPIGRQLVPGWFSWSKTIEFGKTVGATPNGRHAKEPISHGANPVPGFRKDGASTSMATGIARIQPGFGNTAPLQLEMDPGMSIEDGGAGIVKRLIKTHFDMGGTLININILNKEKLLAAHEDPMLYPDLVVRVTGFTAYFATLSPEFRQLVVDRFVEGF